MSKRGPLSKIEKFYIEQNWEMPLDDLSRDLDRAKSVVKAYLNKVTNTKVAPAKQPQPEVPPQPHVGQQIPTSNGATVMTEGGAMASDDWSETFRLTPRGAAARPECITTTKKQ
jgi:hypothetical protein